MSGEVSYDVYVKTGVDSMGREEFGEAVAHFVEHDNAVVLKRRLVARGETVHVADLAVICATYSRSKDGGRHRAVCARLRATDHPLGTVSEARPPASGAI